MNRSVQELPNIRFIRLILNLYYCWDDKTYYYEERLPTTISLSLRRLSHSPGDYYLGHVETTISFLSRLLRKGAGDICKVSHFSTKGARVARPAWGNCPCCDPSSPTPEVRWADLSLPCRPGRRLINFISCSIIKTTSLSPCFAGRGSNEEYQAV